MWSTIGLASRNLAQIVSFQLNLSTLQVKTFTKIWIHVPSERVDTSNPEKKLPTLEAVIEKKTMVNLVCERRIAVIFFAEITFRFKHSRSQSR